MLSIVAFLALMASMSALGVALLWRFGRHLEPLDARSPGRRPYDVRGAVP